MSPGPQPSIPLKTGAPAGSHKAHVQSKPSPVPAGPHHPLGRTARPRLGRRRGRPIRPSRSTSNSLGVPSLGLRPQTVAPTGSKPTVRTGAAKPDVKPGPGSGRDLRAVAERAETEPGGRRVTRACQGQREIVGVSGRPPRAGAPQGWAGEGQVWGCCKRPRHRRASGAGAPRAEEGERRVRVRSAGDRGAKSR